MRKFACCLVGVFLFAFCFDTHCIASSTDALNTQGAYNSSVSDEDLDAIIDEFEKLANEAIELANKIDYGTATEKDEQKFDDLLLELQGLAKKLEPYYLGTIQGMTLAQKNRVDRILAMLAGESYDDDVEDIGLTDFEYATDDLGYYDVYTSDYKYSDDVDWNAVIDEYEYYAKEVISLADIIDSGYATDREYGYFEDVLEKLSDLAEKLEPYSLGYIPGITPEQEARLDKIYSMISAAYEEDEYIDLEGYYYDGDDLDDYNEYEEVLIDYQDFADEDWDALIDEYEKIVMKLGELYKVIYENENVYAEMEKLLYDSEILELKLSGGISYMTQEQINRAKKIALYREVLVDYIRDK